MQVPPEIIYKGVKATSEVDNLLQKQIARLEKVCDYIVRLHVSIEKEQGRHQIGNPYQVSLDIRIPPNHQIVVKRSSIMHSDSRPKPEPDEEPVKIAPAAIRKDEPLSVVIRRTFDSARRQLEKLVERQRGEIKTHSQTQVMAYVDRLFRNEKYGFLRSLEGEQIYFHQNSTLHGEWDRLQVGTGVRYNAEQGEKGLQATSVEIVNKPGISEIHDELHELPVVAQLKKQNKI